MKDSNTDCLRKLSAFIVVIFISVALAGCSGGGGTSSDPGPDPDPDPGPQPTAFDSGNLAPGASFSFTFDSEEAIDYICTIHPDMEGSITIEAGADISGTLTITIQDFTFSPARVTIAPGTEVTWENNDSVTHTATSD